MIQARSCWPILVLLLPQLANHVQQALSRLLTQWFASRALEGRSAKAKRLRAWFAQRAMPVARDPARVRRVNPAHLPNKDPRNALHVNRENTVCRRQKAAKYARRAKSAAPAVRVDARRVAYSKESLQTATKQFALSVSLVIL